MENRLNGFPSRWKEETVRNGSRIISVELNHRAEATVLMRSLKVFHGVARLELPWPVWLETLSENKKLRTCYTEFTEMAQRVRGYSDRLFQGCILFIGHL
jgi:hypothetical protein